MGYHGHLVFSCVPDRLIHVLVEPRPFGSLDLKVNARKADDVRRLRPALVLDASVRLSVPVLSQELSELSLTTLTFFSLRFPHGSSIACTRCRRTASRRTCIPSSPASRTWRQALSGSRSCARACSTGTTGTRSQLFPSVSSSHLQGLRVSSMLMHMPSTTSASTKPFGESDAILFR